MTSPLEVVGPEKVYGAGGAPRVAALRGVNLTLAEGECVAVLDPSGNGKSTFLHLIAELDRPTAGEVRLGGRRVDALGETATRCCDGARSASSSGHTTLIGTRPTATNCAPSSPHCRRCRCSAGWSTSAVLALAALPAALPARRIARTPVARTLSRGRYSWR